MPVKITMETDNVSFQRNRLAQLEVDVCKLAQRYGLKVEMQVTHNHNYSGLTGIVPKLVQNVTTITRTDKDGEKTTRTVPADRDGVETHMIDEKYV